MGLFRGEEAELCACAAGVAIQRELLAHRGDRYGGLGGRVSASTAAR